MVRYNCVPGNRVQGQIRVPGDKSISHRSIMLASIARGVSHITGFLLGEDSLNTINAFRQMGVEIERDGEAVTVNGVGLHGLQAPVEAMDLGNSGTAMRLLTGLLAGQAFDSRLLGDASLSARPMQRIIEPLRDMGAGIDSEPGGCAPLRINGGQRLQAIEYSMPVASAQVKSCLLLAGLYADGITIVHEPAPTRDHSERMLHTFGCDLSCTAGTIRLRGGQALNACDIEVPADISSAAFFMVAATIANDSEITMRHVGINPTRTGVIDILRLMGANIEIIDPREVGGEPVADIRVTSAVLNGIDIPIELVPLAIDEFPVIFVAAACARGTTHLRGAAELRIKESDRIQVMADGLERLGIAARPQADGIIIEGGVFGGGEVDSHGDHRIAMAFSVASLRADSEIQINNCANVSTSFPGFAELARRVGIGISSHDN